MTKKTKKNLYLLFSIALVIKIISSFTLRGPLVFSDEGCIIRIATYFSDHLTLRSCQELTNLDAGTPMPLYSILISPIYAIFHGMKAYYAVLMLNSFLTATLTWPLYGIFKKFIKREQIIYWLIFTILFIPPIFTYEKTLLTESLFTILNIWFLHFYLESFHENKIKNKIKAVIFAMLAGLTRPFGFITLASVIINELIQKKIKKRIMALLIVLFFCLLLVVMHLYDPSLPKETYKKLLTIIEGNNWQLFIKSIKNQINSFSISTFIVPILIFSSHIFKEKDSLYLNKIRFFLISFITINFLISTQHIYGYFLEIRSKELGLLTRYINISTTYLVMFSLIFLERYKKHKFNIFQGIILLTIIISLLYTSSTAKFVQNLDILPFYKITGHDQFNQPNIVYDNSVKNYLLISLPISLFLLIKNKRKLLTILITISMVTFSIFLITHLRKFSHESKLTNYFEKLNKQEITYVLDIGDTSLLHIWKMFALTNHEISFVVTNTSKDFEFKLKSDYFITRYQTDLPLIMKTMGVFVYKNSNNK